MGLTALALALALTPDDLLMAEILGDQLANTVNGNITHVVCVAKDLQCVVDFEDGLSVLLECTEDLSACLVLETNQIEHKKPNQGSLRAPFLRPLRLGGQMIWI